MSKYKVWRKEIKQMELSEKPVLSEGDVVMDNTGKKDTGGSDIFENDIVGYYKANGKPCVGLVQKDATGFFLKRLQEEGTDKIEALENGLTSNLGNKYLNSEMSKVYGSLRN